MFTSFDPANLHTANAFTDILVRSFRRTLRDADTTELFGLDLVRWTRAQTANDVVEMARAGECGTIQFINAHCVNMMKRDAEYREALERADFLLPDGSGLAIAARLAGRKLGENLNGTDLFPAICRYAAKRKVPVFLLGGEPGIAAATAKSMCARFPELRVAGSLHGFWPSEEEDRVIAEINESGAGIVLVGMGVPQQEKWIARVRGKLTAPIVMGVGGLFDYYSGRIRRAPLFFRLCGCEWVWRLMMEPKRLFGRYVIGNPLFLAAALRHAWHAREANKILSLIAKRAFDIAASSTAILLAAPIILLIALAIKIEDGGPVFFSQTRVGNRARPFRMWKFRSMVIDAEARLAAIRKDSEREGACFKMKRDPRITRTGSILRRLSLDELPQLVNVFMGDMTVVGPRPALPREVITYAERERERLGGAPGLTCTWQVSGRADIPFDQQVELDVEYLRRRSFWRDLVLILKTIPAVMTGKGAY